MSTLPFHRHSWEPGSAYIVAETKVDLVVRQEVYGSCSGVHDARGFKWYRMTTFRPRPSYPTSLVHQDIFLLIPLKLAFVYLFLPSLMRHRMRPDMFTRIPRHAASVQVARRNPQLQVR